MRQQDIRRLYETDARGIYDEDLINEVGHGLLARCESFIEGRLSDVVAFLDQLTYSEKSTPGTRENYADWDENINVNRNWYRSRKREAVERHISPEER